MEVVRKKYEKPVIRFVTDVEVVLECLHEVYGLEGERIRLGRNIRNTMIFPFLKMLENHCKGVSASDLQEVLWKAYGENAEKEDFLERAGVLIQPYLKGEEDEVAEMVFQSGLYFEKPYAYYRQKIRKSISCIKTLV